MQRWQHGLNAALALAFAAMLTAVASAWAAPASEAVVAESDDVRALVAPVAVYPDPILAVVLQASTLPLQVVQADRFLTRREKDKNLAPDPDWDKSIIALLNYPRQVRLMSEYIDWTEELGDRVVDDLDAVQAAIQDIRLAAYDAGFLKSDKRQTVEMKDDKVRITSTDPKTVTIPRYDPAALLTALDAIEEADEKAEEVVAAPAPAAAAPKQAAAPARQAAPAPAPAPAATAETPAPAVAAPASAPPAAAAAPPVTPPVIAYGEPENSFWSDAAIFAGGAVVGGLLGWGLTEAFDDDDDHDHGWDEDDWNNDDVEEALRERREFREERRDDVLAVRNERLDTRQVQSAQRQSDRNALRAEREGNRDQQQAARQAQSDNARPHATSGGRSGRADAKSSGPNAGARARRAAAKTARSARPARANSSTSGPRRSAAGPSRSPPSLQVRGASRRGPSVARAISSCPTPEPRPGRRRRSGSGVPRAARLARRAGRREPSRPGSHRHHKSGRRRRRATRNPAPVRASPPVPVIAGRFAPRPIAARRAAASHPARHKPAARSGRRRSPRAGAVVAVAPWLPRRRNASMPAAAVAALPPIAVAALPPGRTPTAAA